MKNKKIFLIVHESLNESNHIPSLIVHWTNERARRHHDILIADGGESSLPFSENDKPVKREDPPPAYEFPPSYEKALKSPNSLLGPDVIQCHI